MPSIPRSLKCCRVSDSGERPEALRPVSSPFSASHTIANRSPPMPQPVGSINPSVAFAAIAASTALPPAFRMSSATWVANGWLVAAMPCVAMTSERDANGLPVTRSKPCANDVRLVISPSINQAIRLIHISGPLWKTVNDA